MGGGGGGEGPSFWRKKDPPPRPPSSKKATFISQNGKRLSSRWVVSTVKTFFPHEKATLYHKTNKRIRRPFRQQIRLFYRIRVKTDDKSGFLGRGGSGAPKASAASGRFSEPKARHETSRRPVGRMRRLSGVGFFLLKEGVSPEKNRIPSRDLLASFQRVLHAV